MEHQRTNTTGMSFPRKRESSLFISIFWTTACAIFGFVSPVLWRFGASYFGFFNAVLQPRPTSDEQRETSDEILQNKPNFKKVEFSQRFILQELMQNGHLVALEKQTQFEPNQTQFQRPFYTNLCRNTPGHRTDIQQNPAAEHPWLASKVTDACCISRNSSICKNVVVSFTNYHQWETNLCSELEKFNGRRYNF